MVSWTLVGLVGSPLLAGALSYKLYGSLNYQTLIDKLASYFISLLLAASVVGCAVYGSRMAGPLPRLVCNLVYVGMSASGLVVSLLCVEVTVLRSINVV